MRLFWKLFFIFLASSFTVGATIAGMIGLLRRFDVVPITLRGHPPLFVPLVASLAISLLFSAVMAWLASKPLRQLREACHQIAQGKLDTRVMPTLGRHHGEMSELAQDFDSMATQLQQLIGAQRRLLHDVSHELRSPLARLEAAIGLARQQPDRCTEMLERIEQESGRVNVLVGELLTLARLEAGSGQIKRERVDLVELITAIADDAQFEAQAAGRDVVLRAGGEFVAEVGAELLYRAFENVIRNAVKYTAAGSVVEVDVGAAADALTVQVADRGPGLPIGALEAVFEPFYRLDADNAGGFGLGLAIARRALESHGGRIVASPRSGGGLLVSISLPRMA
jgi:two-component system OmpR family sensor kinase